MRFITCGSKMTVNINTSLDACLEVCMCGILTELNWTELNCLFSLVVPVWNGHIMELAFLLVVPVWNADMLVWKCMSTNPLV